MSRSTRDVTSLAAAPLARGPGARMTVSQAGGVARARAWWLTTDPGVGVATRKPTVCKNERRRGLGHLVVVLASGAACEGGDAGGARPTGYPMLALPLHEGVTRGMG